jgi:hypothetical protein
MAVYSRPLHGRSSNSYYSIINFFIIFLTSLADSVLIYLVIIYFMVNYHMYYSYYYYFYNYNYYNYNYYYYYY